MVSAKFSQLMRLAVHFERAFDQSHHPVAHEEFPLQRGHIRRISVLEAAHDDTNGAVLLLKVPCTLQYRQFSDLEFYHCSCPRLRPQPVRESTAVRSG